MSQPVLDKRTNLVQAVLVAADKCSTDAASLVFQDARFTPSDRSVAGSWLSVSAADALLLPPAVSVHIIPKQAPCCKLRLCRLAPAGRASRISMVQLVAATT